MAIDLHAASWSLDAMKTLGEILSDWVRAQRRADDQPLLLMLSGAQGIGKSTAMRQLARDIPGLVTLGLDDFYLTQAERRSLADRVHPLFETRGPPGTHDLALLHQVLDQLLNGAPTSLPVFDKASDDRCPPSDWPWVSEPPKVILLEGWMIGALPDAGAPNSAPMNAVEAQDEQGHWRSYQERALADDYAKLWDLADAFCHLCAPDFSAVLNWRLQQEESNLGLVPGTLPDERRLWVARFIQHYERITRRMLAGGRRSGLAIHLDAQRRVVATHQSS